MLCNTFLSDLTELLEVLLADDPDLAADWLFLFEDELTPLLDDLEDELVDLIPPLDLDELFPDFTVPDDLLVLEDELPERTAPDDLLEELLLTADFGDDDLFEELLLTADLGEDDLVLVA